MTRTPTSAAADRDRLDETYTRMHATGPEFQGWLSNHGPMAADALIRLGRGDVVEKWVDDYSTRLEAAPPAGGPSPRTNGARPSGIPHAWATGAPCSNTSCRSSPGVTSWRCGGRGCWTVPSHPPLTV